MTLYHVLHCGQVKVHIKINFSSLVTTMYSGGGGGSQSKYLFCLQLSDRQEVKFLYCCTKFEKIRDNRGRKNV